MATPAGYVLTGLLLLAMVPAYPVNPLYWVGNGLILSVHSKETTCSSANGSFNVAVAGGTPPYQYSITGYAARQNGQFDQLPAGTYTLTVRDAAGLGVDTLLVLANQSQAPALSVAGSSDVTGCLGTDGNVLLQVSGGTPPYVFAYEGSNFQRSSQFTQLLKGEYHFLVQDANGCGDSVSWLVSDNCNASFTVGFFTRNAGCTNSGLIETNPQGGTLPFSFAMNDVNFQSSGNFTGLAPGRYAIYVKDATGQENYTSIPIYANCLLQVIATATASDCQQISGAVSVSATAGVPPYEYSIDGIHFQSGGDFSGLQPGTYTVSVRDSAGNIRSTTVTVTSPLIVNAGPLATICQGGGTTLDGYTNSPDFSWSPVTDLSGSKTLDPIASPDRTAEYHLTAVSGSCRVTDSVEVTVTPAASVFAGVDTAVAIDEPLALMAIDVDHSGFDSWEWTPVTGLNNPLAADPVLVPDQTGVFTYTVLAAAPGGCKAEASVTISVFKGPAIYVPNAFTPNGDGHNDVLKPFPIGIRTFQYFVVYNRSGQMVFRTANPETGWDGRIDGHNLPSGAFVWVAAGIDDEGKTIIKKGTVLLIR